MIVNPQEFLDWLELPAHTALTKLALKNAEAKVKEYVRYNIEQATYLEYYPLQQPAQSDQDQLFWEIHGNYGTATALAYPDAITLLQLPVRQILNVWSDPAGYFGQMPNAFSAAPLVQGPDYYLKIDTPGIAGGPMLSFCGILQRRWRWPVSPGSVKVNYVAGLTQAELDSGEYRCIKEAVLETAADFYMRGKAMKLGQRAAIQSEGMGGGQTATYINERLRGLSIPDIAADLLEGFVSWADGGL